MKELEPPTTLSHYRIVSKLGAGGMGEVYIAQDTKLDRRVAIKFLHDEFSKDTDKLNRFIQAKAASALTFLEKEIAERGPQCPGFAIDPALDDLRSDPRFAALVQKVESSKVD